MKTFSKIMILCAFASLIVASTLSLSSCGSKDAKAADDAKTEAGANANASANANTTSSAQRINPSEVSKVTALGRVEPEDQITALSMETPGIVSKVTAQDGDNLQAGSTILELDHSVESARLQLAEARVRTQEEDLKGIRSQIQSAETKAQNFRERYNRLKNIFDNGAETRQNLDNAKTDFDTAEREVERLQSSLRSAESRLAELRADARISSAEIRRKVLKAPTDGVLLKLTPNVGSAVAVGAAVGDFAPKGAVTVLCEVDELFVSSVAVGQKAQIRLQGNTEIVADGVVSAIGPYLKKKSLFSDEAGALEDRRVREVRVRLSNAGALLLNSRVECVIAVK
ncbi:MAG: HlyD family efflux transporter periplasmic adaptor subunit [Candidatus Kapaibacterium sp.]|nr:MAG: HlyD family efflux transporter periplasmic adaptor subunit [Candidatus Kapabacteria bacterium]